MAGVTYMQTFAEFLTEYLKENKLSIKEAAERCDVERTLFGRYAKGTRVPSGWDKIKSIAQGLQMQEKDRAVLYKMYGRIKSGAKRFVTLEYMEKIFNGDYNPEMVMVEVPEDTDSQAGTGEIRYLDEKQQIYSCIRTLLTKSDKVYLRVEPYEEIQQMITRWIKPECEFEYIIQLYDEIEDNADEILFLYRLCTVFHKAKKGSVYYYYKGYCDGEKQKAELNFIITEKGMVLFDKTMSNGIFTMEEVQTRYYKGIYDRMKKESDVYVQSMEWTSEEIAQQETGKIQNENTTLRLLEDGIKSRIHIQQNQPEYSIRVEEEFLVESFRRFIKNRQS